MTEKVFYTQPIWYFTLYDLQRPEFPYKGTRNYSLDENGNLIGLSLDFCPLYLLPPEYLVQFSHLKQLSIKNDYLRDYTFLKELKGLTSLDLSSNKLTDVNFLKEFQDFWREDGAIWKERYEYKEKKYPIEIKLRYSEKTYQDGLKQQGAYMDSLGCKEGRMVSSV